MLDNDTHEPAATAFHTADYQSVARHMPTLAKLGVRLEITPDAPDVWPTDEIGFFGEPGSNGDGQFWRVGATSIYFTLPDGRAGTVSGVDGLAAFLDRRNRLPGGDAD